MEFPERYYDPFPAEWYNIEDEYVGTWMMGYCEGLHEYVRLYPLPDKLDKNGDDSHKIKSGKDELNGSLS